jgi:hypothetical protein
VTLSGCLPSLISSRYPVLIFGTVPVKAEMSEALAAGFHLFPTALYSGSSSHRGVAQNETRPALITNDLLASFRKSWWVFAK